MADKNKINISIGLALLVIAFSCTIVVAYFLVQTDQKNNKNIASFEVQLANLINKKSSGQLLPGDAERVERDPISLDDFLSRAESIYGEQELDRKNGVLWIDRETSTYMITLGAVNGLEKGHVLSIIYNGEAIGEVTVDTAFDVVSYVTLIDKEMNYFKYNYYRVIIKSLL